MLALAVATSVVRTPHASTSRSHETGTRPMSKLWPYEGNTYKTTARKHNYTSGRSNWTKRPHRRGTWTVQLRSPGGANEHSHLTHASLDPPESTSQTASWSVQPFLHSSRQSRYLTMGRPFLPQNCLFARGIWTPSNTYFLRLTWVHILNGISIGSAVLAGLTIVTERRTTLLRL